MLIRYQGPIWRFAPAVFTLAISCSAGAQSNAESGAVPQAVREAPAETWSSMNPTEAASRLDSLVSRMHDQYSLFRVQALEAIDASVTIDAETATSILQSALEDKDPLVAEAALRALIRRDDEQLRLVRESDLEQHPGETSELGNVRFAARNQDTSALRELMRNGDALVQETAFEALASNNTAAAIEALRAELLDLTSLHRLQTLELFVRSPYTSSSATLMPILELASEDEDPLVQERAKQVLAEKRAETRLDSEPAVQADTNESAR